MVLSADAARWAERSPSYPPVHTGSGQPLPPLTLSASVKALNSHTASLWGFVGIYLSSCFMACKCLQCWAWTVWLIQSFGFSCCAGFVYSVLLYYSGKPRSKQAAVGAGSFFSVLSRSGISCMPVWADLGKPLFWFVRLLGLFCLLFFFFFPFWFCNAVSKLNRACFINAHCHVMQQWKSLVRKVSQCMCPKEAPGSVFKQDINRHLATPKEQACFFLHARLGMVSWQSKDSTTLLFSTCPFW